MPILASLGAASAKAFGLTGGAAVATVDYLVIAGGGAGGGQRGQGGGAGGARTSFPGGTQIEVGIGTPITVTVGGGGAGGSGQNDAGGDSIIDSFITSNGGGGATSGPGQSPTGVGGSGAGSHRGNEGDFSPAEGNPGGSPDPSQFGPGTDFVPGTGFGAGGGGAGGGGSNSPSPTVPTLILEAGMALL